MKFKSVTLYLLGLFLISSCSNSNNKLEEQIYEHNKIKIQNLSTRTSDNYELPTRSDIYKACIYLDSVNTLLRLGKNSSANSFFNKVNIWDMPDTLKPYFSNEIKEEQSLSLKLFALSKSIDIISQNYNQRFFHFYDILPHAYIDESKSTDDSLQVNIPIQCRSLILPNYYYSKTPLSLEEYHKLPRIEKDKISVNKYTIINDHDIASFRVNKQDIIKDTIKGFFEYPDTYGNLYVQEFKVGIK